MGKKSRQKRQHNKKKETPGDKDKTALKGPVVLQRIRHPDPKTRHAALSALGHTSFDPDSLATRKKKLDPALIQAVREQLMDRDVNCAIAAAGCLANYAAYSNDDGLHALTAGWTVLLVGRLKDCLTELPSQRTAPGTSASTKVALWWELAERCLTCLVHLLENNPMAVERLLPPSVPRSTDTQQQKQLRQDIFRILKELLGTAASPRIQTLCCRCFHSAWDDNPDLVLPWLKEQPEEAKQTLELLQTSISSDSMVTPARLHAVGAWLSLWVIDENMLHGAERCTSHCMVLLARELAWDNTARRIQIDTLKEAFAANLKLQEDSALERQVLTEQEHKKEPARLIARRLKKHKDEEMHEERPPVDASAEEDTEMMEDKNVLDWDAACDQWNDSVRSVQLALEITANLTSASSTEASFEGDNDDDDDIMREVPSLDAKMAQALLANDIPDRVVHLLTALSLDSMDDVPEVPKETIADLQSKAAVCVGHCLTNLSGDVEWNVPSGLWQHLKDSLRAAVDVVARESVVAAMVVALRRSGGKGATSDDLDFLLGILSTGSPVVVRDVTCMLGFLLSSQPHSVEVNQKVVNSLIHISSKDSVSAMVLSEALCVLMDIYGNDECHPAVFELLNVLNYFQTSLPLLKQRISLDRGADQEDIEQWKETVMNAARFIQYKKGHVD